MNLILKALAKWSQRAQFNNNHRFELPRHRFPNYVSSTVDVDDNHYVAPIKTTLVINEIIPIMVTQHYTLLNRSNNELHFCITVGKHQFIDDVRLRLEGSTLHIISSSRVGYSDLGTNRKRVDSLRETLQPI